MVIDVVSTGSVDPERCLESHKITTMTLNEIRGRVPTSSFPFSPLYPSSTCSEIFVADLGQLILDSNRKRKLRGGIPDSNGNTVSAAKIFIPF